MLFNCILLALSVSIDSLTIGISYGLKKTKIDNISNTILFAISFCITCGSIFLGHYIFALFSPILSTVLGSSFLIILGIYNIYKSLNTSPTDYDIDHSNNIDAHESIFLGLALSIDSICVGIGSGIIGLNDIILPFLIATFQLAFLNCGNFISQKIVKYINVSEQTLSIFSSIILILVGIFRSYQWGHP